MTKSNHTRPADIERTSMSIISEELAEKGIEIPAEHAAIVKRAIHASADFDYAENLRFYGAAAAAARAYLQCGGGVIITDTNMALAGISKVPLKKLGAEVHCYTGEAWTAAQAKELGVTRAVAGMMYAAEQHPQAIYALGNAPTALMYLAERIRQGMRPALVIGVPVGFVNVCESKEELLDACREMDIPAVVAMGRKGGSNIAAAIVNAVLYEITDTLDPAARGWS